MAETLSRPDHLPDFQTPPLNEVVVGVQFAPARGYQQIRASEVWGLYKAQFPAVEEMPPIPPAFETFGLSAGAQINFGIVTGAQHDRFWFLSPGGDELIQFQQDRLLHNWRKVGDQKNEYPRFERMVLKFEAELLRLETYFAELAPQTLNCNQAEISYINHMDLNGDSLRKIDDWVRFFDFGEREPDEVSVSLRRRLKSADGKPFGRLTCELNTAVNSQGHRILVLTLTVRGAPSGPTVAAALELLKRGRDVIVEEFAAITTDSAHKVWGRIR